MNNPAPLCLRNSKGEPTCDWTGVREKSYGKLHDVFAGAPDQWAADRGATHTLWVFIDGSTRPARLLKTVMYVGLDEDENGNIVWTKWQIKHYDSRQSQGDSGSHAFRNWLAAQAE